MESKQRVESGRSWLRINIWLANDKTTTFFFFPIFFCSVRRLYQRVTCLSEFPLSTPSRRSFQEGRSRICLGLSTVGAILRHVVLRYVELCAIFSRTPRLRLPLPEGIPSLHISDERWTSALVVHCGSEAALSPRTARLN